MIGLRILSVCNAQFLETIAKKERVPAQYFRDWLEHVSYLLCRTNDPRILEHFQNLRAPKSAKGGKDGKGKGGKGKGGKGKGGKGKGGEDVKAEVLELDGANYDKVWKQTREGVKEGITINLDDASKIAAKRNDCRFWTVWATKEKGNELGAQYIVSLEFVVVSMRSHIERLLSFLGDGERAVSMVTELFGGDVTGFLKERSQTMEKVKHLFNTPRTQSHSDLNSNSNSNALALGRKQMKKEQEQADVRRNLSVVFEDDDDDGDDDDGAEGEEKLPAKQQSQRPKVGSKRKMSEIEDDDEDDDEGDDEGEPKRKKKPDPKKLIGAKDGRIIGVTKKGDGDDNGNGEQSFDSMSYDDIVKMKTVRVQTKPQRSTLRGLMIFGRNAQIIYGKFGDGVGYGMVGKEMGIGKSAVSSVKSELCQLYYIEASNGVWITEATIDLPKGRWLSSLSVTSKGLTQKYGELLFKKDKDTKKIVYRYVPDLTKIFKREKDTREKEQPKSQPKPPQPKDD